MAKIGFPRNNPWTPLERAIWLLSVVFFIVAGVLLVAKESASWAVLTVSMLVVALGVVRYRAEPERPNRDADEHDE
jgi:hypothetical protein